MTWRTKISTRRGGLGGVTPRLHSPAGPIFWGIWRVAFWPWGHAPPPNLGTFERAAFFSDWAGPSRIGVLGYTDHTPLVMGNSPVRGGNSTVRGGNSPVRGGSSPVRGEPRNTKPTQHR
eukprot:1190155-Prorocentrum_minimum.AAC.2